jgi:hypothetical protein
MDPCFTTGLSMTLTRNISACTNVIAGGCTASLSVSRALSSPQTNKDIKIKEPASHLKLKRSPVRLIRTNRKQAEKVKIKKKPEQGQRPPGVHIFSSLTKNLIRLRTKSGTYLTKNLIHLRMKSGT